MSSVKFNQELISKTEKTFLQKLVSEQSFWVSVALLGICFVMFFVEDAFSSKDNLFNITRNFSFIGIMAIGMTFVIITAGIDLSVGSIMMLSLMLLAIVAKAGMPWYIVVLVPMFAGLLCGMFNGLGITLLRMPHPFIMTLGTLYIFRGAGNLVSGGVPISGFTEEVRYLGHGRIDLTWLGLEESQYLILVDQPAQYRQDK